MNTYLIDFCPVNPRCIIVEDSAGAFIGFDRKCTHHASVQADLLLTDQQLFNAIDASSRVKETARWAAKVELALAEEVSVPYQVASNGNFILGRDATGNLMNGWPSGSRRTNLIAIVTGAVEQLNSPLGTSILTVG